MKVFKRDGRLVAFQSSRIKNAITAALEATGNQECHLTDKVVEKVCLKCFDGISVEQIQDLVEAELGQCGAAQTLKAYHEYREKRNKARNWKHDTIISDIVSCVKNDVTRENANMNADTPAGMMMKISSEASKPFVDAYLLSEEARRFVQANLLHIHDKDYYPTRSLTCVQSPIDRILSGGFRAGHGESRPAKRIETASILACISIEQTQNEQHGGQSIPAFDFYMAPYVRKTYIEEIKKLEKLLNTDMSELYDAPIDDYKIYDDPDTYQQFAISQTVHRTHQAMEALVHNLNEIHSRGGNQVVFSSLNYGTDTSAEGRCVIRELLKTTYRGVGNSSTAIFPIQIMKMKAGVNKHPGDPNYDLYQLACKVTARRFFPNFLNLDATFNRHKKWNATDPERYKYEVATMGCVSGDEIVTYTLKNQLFVEPFKTMWSKLSRMGEVRSASEEGYDEGEFINLSNLNVTIADRDTMVDCLRIIKNPDQGNWCSVVFSNGRHLTCTDDHPWSVKEKGIVLTRDLAMNDEIEFVSTQISGKESNHTEEEAWFKGFFLCDGCYDSQLMATVGIDEKDIVNKYCAIMHDVYRIHIYVNRQRRGKKGDYYELKGYMATPNVKSLNQELRKEFVGVTKKTRQFPSWVFQSTDRVRASFLAGIIDADGYINNHRNRTKVQVGSTNKVIAIQTMLLAQSLGVPAKMYENHYCSERPDAIRYRVEFDAFELLLEFMASEKKKERVVELFVPINLTSGKVTKIEQLGNLNKSSYDVSTSSEHFNVSGIRSHNCRTRVFENRFGEKTSIGRGNLSFSTINLPGLALSVMDEKDEWTRVNRFFDKLRELIYVTGRQLYDRYCFQREALAKQFPLLMSGIWIGSDNLTPEDHVEPVIKHGTLGVGFIGLAECLIALIGKHHGESWEAQELGLDIISFIKQHVDELSNQYNLNFSVLATPAEGLSGKFTKSDKEKYGVIPGITDKDYYTNSNHIPVYYHCSAKHKAAVEGPYHGLTRGGHIFYVELDGDATHNVKAIDDIIKLMDKYNIGYASVNHNRNRCMDCGYEDAEKDLKECPVCHSSNIDRLQRITGYLVGTTDRWNSGKLAELNDRVTHG